MIKNNTTNIIDDLCKITTIPAASINRLVDISEKCICNCVYESQLNQELITDVNIGIGNLIISIEDNSLVYKFIPNSKFERNLVTTIVNKKNPLTEKVETTFINRIINTYKDMF